MRCSYKPTLNELLYCIIWSCSNIFCHCEQLCIFMIILRGVFYQGILLYFNDVFLGGSLLCFSHSLHYVVLWLLNCHERLIGNRFFSDSYSGSTRLVPQLSIIQCMNQWSWMLRLCIHPSCCVSWSKSVPGFLLYRDPHSPGRTGNDETHSPFHLTSQQWDWIFRSCLLHYRRLLHKRDCWARLWNPWEQYWLRHPQ